MPRTGQPRTFQQAKVCVWTGLERVAAGPNHVTWSHDNKGVWPGKTHAQYIQGVLTLTVDFCSSATAFVSPQAAPGPPAAAEQAMPTTKHWSTEIDAEVNLKVSYMLQLASLLVMHLFFPRPPSLVQPQLHLPLCVRC